MKTKKTFKVVILPTKKVEVNSPYRKDGILFIADNGRLFTKKQLKQNWQFNYNPQHLYIISDDEIKEGDWVVTNSGIGKCIKTFDNNLCEVDLGWGTTQTKSNCRKIVATTDKSLLVNKSNKFETNYSYLPQIPESFIKAYIKAYNESSPITEVDLECYFTAETGYDKFLCIKTREDNTCIVHQSKMYSREEMLNLIKWLNENCYMNGGKLQKYNTSLHTPEDLLENFKNS